MPIRTTLLDEVGDPDAPIGSRPWAIHMIGQMRLAANDLQSDVSRLKMVIGACESHEVWKHLGYASLGLLCKKERIKLDDVDIEAIKLAKDGQPLGTVLGKRGRPTLKDRNNPDSQKADNVSLKFGNQSSYLLARMRRDCPELVEQYESGGFKSVRAAAIAAGIIKEPTADEKAVKAIAKCENPIAVAKSLWDRCDTKQRQTLAMCWKEWAET